MTKKILFGMFAAVGLLATSCSDDELNNSLASGDYVNASFSIETPEGILTRAIGDGTQADKVACAIFYNGEELSELRRRYMRQQDGYLQRASGQRSEVSGCVLRL